MHRRKLYDMLIDPTGLPPEAAKARRAAEEAAWLIFARLEGHP